MSRGQLRGDKIRVGSAVTFAERFSREGVNVTPPALFSGSALATPPNATEPVIWFVEVTDEVLESPIGFEGLYPGKIYLPDPTATPPWREEDCFVLPLPDRTHAIGDTGLGRIVGWQSPDGATFTSPRPIYTIVPGGANAAIDCGDKAWWTGLDTTDCVKLTVVSGISDQTIYLEWSTTPDPDGWTSATTLTVPTNSGAVLFWVEGGRPHLSVNGLELGEECSGDGYTIFSGGPATGHDDGSTTTCELRRFRVRVECCCAPEGWGGAGWYCTVGAGEECGTDAASVVELLDGDECDFEGVICSGPYGTEAEAIAACATVLVEDCCSSTPQRRTLKVTLSGGTGDGAALDATTFNVVHPGTGTTWTLTDITLNSQTGHVATFACVSSAWRFEIGGPGGTWLHPKYAFFRTSPTSGTCPSAGPVVFAGMSLNLPYTGTIDATVEELP